MYTCPKPSPLTVRENFGPIRAAEQTRQVIEPNEEQLSALKGLEWEIKRLPISESCDDLETEFCWLHFHIGRLPDHVAVKHYQALRDRVTRTRFDVANQVIRDLEARLANLGGMAGWNRRPVATELANWRAGKTEGETVEAYLAKADRFVQALQEAIAAEQEPPRTNRGIGGPGKTLREADKRARHARNKANRAAENQQHQKGPSGGGGYKSPRNKSGKGKK